MVYDAAREQMVLFGGYGDYGSLTDTWTFGGQTPKPVTPVITWAPAATTTDKTALSGILNATVAGGISGSFSYTANGATVTGATVLSCSTTPYALVATFTPADATAYTTATATALLTVTDNNGGTNNGKGGGNNGGTNNGGDNNGGSNNGGTNNGGTNNGTNTCGANNGKK
jgi:hypothetical protein